MNLIKPKYNIINISNGALDMIELVGRTCYKTEDRITSDSKYKFVKNLVSRKHGAMLEFGDMTVKFKMDRACCYSDDTQVLTENGFEYFKDIKENTKIYSLNDENKLVLVNFKKKIEYNYIGEMYNFKSTQIDLNVTPNHDNWVFDYEKRSEKTRIWKFISANDMMKGGRRYLFYKSCSNFDGKSPKHIYIPETTRKNGGGYITYPEMYLDSKLFLKLVGLWVTDGYISYGKGICGNQLGISQSKQKVREIIFQLCTDLNLKFHPSKTEISINSPQLFTWFANNFTKPENVKKTYYLKLPKWLKELDRSLICEFLSGVVLGDGSVNENSTCIYTSSFEFAKDLVELYLKIGKCANIGFVKDRSNYKRNDGRKIYSKVPQYVVYVVNTLNHLYNKSYNDNFSKISYSGNVYCLELENYHKLYVLRNGKACWSGNSHELVRHRLCSFAQESQRYVAYRNHVSFIIPSWSTIDERYIDSIDDIDCLSDNEYIFYSQLKASENVYLKLLQNGMKAELARGVLPNATATEINVKTNFREWMNIFGLRCDKSSHPDMRKLMTNLLTEVKQKVPVIFDDINI